MKEKQRFRNNIPNIITSLRFAGTFIIIFLTPLEPLYFAVYTLTGVTDVLDGFLSRKMNAVSTFGARLDSVADLFFYSVSLIKLLPKLIAMLPQYIWIFVAAILAIRIASYIIAAVKFRRFASHHTWLNKATGVFVFAVPYFLVTGIGVYFCFAVCAVSLLSTLEDLYIHISSPTYDDNVKTVLPI
ncbi:MAG: CDP-alcohol phosphatidyltransferase family protein [Clostridia bacterium]|nr:CDP-alcohol phosphatidyltransferase family protein [Clostridia bacterium]